VLGQAERLAKTGEAVDVSAWTGEGIERLRQTIAGLIDDDPETRLTLSPGLAEIGDMLRRPDHPVRADRDQVRVAGAKPGTDDTAEGHFPVIPCDLPRH
jgi:GTP-binding protein HflX